MIFEKTGIYWFILFVLFIIVYIFSVKSLALIFKRAEKKKFLAYIPFYNTKILMNITQTDKNLFGLSFIPFYNILIFYKLYINTCKAFNMDINKAKWFLFVPSVYFYELTSPIYAYNYKEKEPNIFQEIQDSLNDKGEQKKEEPKIKEDYSIYLDEEPSAAQPLKVENIHINPNNNNYKINQNNPSVSSIKEIKIDENIPIIDIDSTPKTKKDIFADNFIKEEDEVKIVKTKDQQIKQKAVITDKKGFVECPKCHAKLVKGTTVCFMCGTKL